MNATMAGTGVRPSGNVRVPHHLDLGTKRTRVEGSITRGYANNAAFQFGEGMVMVKCNPIRRQVVWERQVANVFNNGSSRTRNRQGPPVTVTSGGNPVARINATFGNLACGAECGSNVLRVTERRGSV